MARYYFNVRDGGIEQDLEGTELANLDAARNEAVVFAGEMLRRQPGKLWETLDLHVDVTDDRGLILFTVTITVNEAPSTRRALNELATGT